MRRWTGIAFTLLSLAVPAFAQSPSATKPDPAAVKALAVNYELSSADGTRKCPVALETRPVGQYFALSMNRQACSKLFGFLTDVTGWRPGVAGAILLVGTNARLIAEFSEGVGGVYESLREGDGVYFLANLQFVDPASRVQAADLIGEWNFSRPGAGVICRVTLTDEIAGEQLFTVKLQSKCDAGIEKFAPSAWKLQRGDLVLVSASGDSLRFERQDNVWNKVPDKPRPLMLTRP